MYRILNTWEKAEQSDESSRNNLSVSLQFRCLIFHLFISFFRGWKSVNLWNLRQSSHPALYTDAMATKSCSISVLLYIALCHIYWKRMQILQQVLLIKLVWLIYLITFFYECAIIHNPSFTVPNLVFIYIYLLNAGLLL